MTGGGPLVMAPSRVLVNCQEAVMESMKSARPVRFAAHQSGSARTLTLVPGNRLGAVHGAESETPQSPPPPMRSLNGVTPNGMTREPAGEPASTVREAGVRTVNLRAGQKFFGPEGGGETVYLVRQGCVALFKALPGRREVCVGLLGPNDVFTQEATHDGATVSGVTAEILSDATIIVLKMAALPRLMSASPDLAMAIVTGFSQRLTDIQGLVEQLLSRDITLRLASVLLAVGDRFGEPADAETGFVAVAIPMPHKLLARLIGANRVTVTRVITEFRAAGLADSSGRNHISVHPARLREYMREVSRQAVHAH
jgi:CRP-like cAMP-binding protein